MDILHEITIAASHNPFLTGGAVVAGLSFIINYAKGLPSRAINMIKNHLFTSVEVYTNDVLYGYIDTYIQNKGRRIKHGMGETKYSISGKREAKIVPHKGVLPFMLFNKSFMWIEKISPGKTTPPSSDVIKQMAAVCIRESFKISFISLDSLITKKFLNHILAISKPEEKTSKTIFSCTSHSDCWSAKQEISKRPLESIIIEDDLHLKILKDINKFRESRDRYLKLGIPYHRGYLLYGEPGNGKTSIIHALASEVGLALNCLSLSSVSGDSGLISLFRYCYGGIIFIEDVDCIFNTREQEETKVTFSGLLNAMDGILSFPGNIIIATTNHIEKLDPAFLRPGRIDMKFYIGNATGGQAYKLFNKFFDNHELAMQFADQIKDGVFNMSQLQEYLLGYEEMPEKAVLNVSSLYESKLELGVSRR